MSFSKGLTLASLDDYINPGLECINPVNSNKLEPFKNEVKGLPTKILKLEVGDNDIEWLESEPKLEKASISLTDCLACSGCITSAESVLVQQQSHNQLLELLKDNPTNKKIVITLAPQSISSIATKFNLTNQQVRLKVSSFFKSIGCHFILDAGLGNDITLIESGMEVLNTDGMSTVLASSCPGWICYAEKTHPFLIPNISKIKSPQQIMGSIVKYFFGPRNHLTPDQIYHVTVMPCYDKKLEASRQDFYSDLYQTREIDLVLTTTELELLIPSNFTELDLAPLDHIFLNTNSELPFNQSTLNLINNDQSDWSKYLKESSMFNLTNNSSGGCLEFLMAILSNKIGYDKLMMDQNFMRSNPNLENESLSNLTIKTIRNNDFKEYILKDDQNNEVIRMAKAYGFRNIQNIVRKMKLPNQKGKYHYVEIMACPSGCINGGGQCKPFSSTISAKQWVQSMTTKFSNQTIEPQFQSDSLPLPYHNPYILALYKEWFDIIDPTIQQDNQKRDEMFKTQYHVIEKLDTNTIGLTAKW